MPHRLIGRTADFGSVCLGSSPSGATRAKAAQTCSLFLCQNFSRTPRPLGLVRLENRLYGLLKFLCERKGERKAGRIFALLDGIDGLSTDV